MVPTFFMKIRFNIDDYLLILLNDLRNEKKLNTSDTLNYIINYYFYKKYQVDILGVLNEEDIKD